jgi:cell division protease FtsH
VSLSTLSRGTPGFTGADLENLVNEAALLAARRAKTKIEMEDFESSKDKVLMGVERRTMIISEDEKRLTAYHEAGHTLVAKFLPTADPIHKVTIIPRGRALGITQQIPAEDKHTLSREYILNKIAIFLGGRAAEETVLNTQTTGAGNDLEMATEWARKMVCDFGMSEKMGPLTFGKKDEHIFLGREIAQHKDYSEKTAVEIDTEIKQIVLENYARAKEIISQHMEKLHRLASALLEKEVLAGEEIDQVLGLKPLLPEPPAGKFVQEGKLL